MPTQFKHVGRAVLRFCLFAWLGLQTSHSPDLFAQQKQTAQQAKRSNTKLAPIESRTWNSRGAGGLIEGSCIGVQDDQVKILVGNLEYLVPVELFHPEDAELIRIHFGIPSPFPEQPESDPVTRNECKMLHTMRGGVFPESKIVGHDGDLILLADFEGKTYRVPFYLFAEGVRSTVRDTITRLDGKTYVPKAQPSVAKPSNNRVTRSSNSKPVGRPNATRESVVKTEPVASDAKSEMKPPIASPPPTLPSPNPIPATSSVTELSPIGPERVWSMRGGKITFRGRLLKVKPPMVEIQTTEGQKRQIPLELLEPRDRQFAESLAANGKVGEPPVDAPVFRNEDAKFVLKEGIPQFVLDGQKLLKLDEPGKAPGDEVVLPEPFRILYPQANHWIAATDREIHLLDKDSFRTKKKLELWKYKRINDIAPHPTQPIYFVSVEHVSDQVKKNPAENQKIVVVDLKSGEINEPEETYGMWLKMHPSGKFLLSGFHAAFQAGPSEEIDITGRLVPRLNVEHIDVLNRFKISGHHLILDEQFENAGANGQGLAITPTGDRVCYLSFTGYPTFSYQVNAFQSDNFNVRPVVFEAKDRCDCKSIVFDHSGKLAASPTAGGAALFDASTGHYLDGALSHNKDLDNAIVLDLAFSSNSEKLLFIVSRAGSAPYLVEAQLNKEKLAARP